MLPLDKEYKHNIQQEAASCHSDKVNFFPAVWPNEETDNIQYKSFILHNEIMWERLVRWMKKYCGTVRPSGLNKD